MDADKLAAARARRPRREPCRDRQGTRRQPRLGLPGTSAPTTRPAKPPSRQHGPRYGQHRGGAHVIPGPSGARRPGRAHRSADGSPRQRQAGPGTVRVWAAVTGRCCRRGVLASRCLHGASGHGWSVCEQIVGSVTYKDSKIVIDSIKAGHNRPAACIACLVLGRRPCLLATGTLCSLQEAGPLEYAGHHADDRNDPLEEPPVRTAAPAHETPPSPPLPGDFLLIEDYSKPGVSQALSQVQTLGEGEF